MKGSGSEQRLTKRVLENQATATMASLWEEVQEAEQGINEGEPWALDKFIHSAGTMVETFRLAKSNFTKNRVGAGGKLWLTPLGYHSRAEEPEVRLQGRC